MFLFVIEYESVAAPRTGEDSANPNIGRNTERRSELREK
jgi:hypothetical protein